MPAEPVKTKADSVRTGETVMSTLAHCAEEQMFQDWEPQRIEISEEIASRLTPWQLNKLREMLDGKIGEVDWDLNESSTPIVVTRSFACVVGWTDKVEMPWGENKKVFYAQVQRKGRPIWGRFVRRSLGRETTSITAVLRPVGESPCPVGWLVVAAYVGEAAPPFPGDPFETSDSEKYWMNHALLDGALPYRKGTETTRRPW
ncbi:MAG: hypothetical protein RDU25_00510 [Patescibacteria group bacterium]|nr:hypothetical protein [Patescibacteria group bacterium]